MKRVLASGIFERPHAGHRFFLEQAKQLGDELIVLVTSDAVARKEGKQPTVSALNRAAAIEALAIGDSVIVGRSDGDVLKTVQSIQPDIIALGFDQTMEETELKNFLAQASWYGTIVRIGRSDA